MASEWIVNGTKYTWQMVESMIASGEWTVAQAAKNICMPVKGLRMRLAMTGVQAGTASGGGLGAFFGLPTLGAAITATGIGLVLGAAVVTGIGIYNYSQTGSPIKFGSQADRIKQMQAMPTEDREKLRNVAEPVAVDGNQQDKYYIWIVGGYKEIIVGQRSYIEEQPSRSLTGWGLESVKVKDRNPAWAPAAGPFDSAADARKAYEEAMLPNTTRHLPNGWGTVAKFKFDGQERSIDNALRFLK